MTHAERYSTAEACAPHTLRRSFPKRTPAMVALALTLGVSSAAVSWSGAASADQISDARAQAASITAKLQAINAQEAALSGQVEAADYHLSQLQAQIAANQAAVARDQVAVARQQGQLRVEAISDYTSSGTSSQMTQMFSSNPNTTDIRSEYSSIATGNVTTTIDRLHTAQAELQANQAALQQQSGQATTTRNGLQSSESQAAALSQQYQGTLDSVDANIQKLVEAQQAAQAAAARAAATAAFNAKVAAAQRAQAAQAAQAALAAQQVSTSQAGSGQTGGGSGSGSFTASAPVAASAPPPVPGGVAGAIQAAESQLGVRYVWGGETPGVGFDCSGLVQWSFAQAGIGLPRTSGAQYAATVQIPLADIEPGDLLFYGPGGSDHVALYIGGGSMIEAPQTGQVVHITGVRTGDGFAGVGRVG